MNNEESEAINPNVNQAAQDMLTIVKVRWLDAKPLEVYPVFMDGKL